MKVDTLIVGAGPAGLAAALKLAEKKQQFLVIEKNSAVGGLAKTYIFEEDEIASSNKLIFRTDNGPHRFFSKNQELYEFIEDLLREQWIEVKRQTRQFIDGKFYDYPVKPVQALANVGSSKATKMVLDYVTAQFRYKILRKKINNFEDYIVANFGRELGNFNMINYTEKIWGVPASTIHTDWAIQRIKGLSIGFLIRETIKGLIKPLKTEKIRTLAGVFYYPEHGTGLIYEKIKEKLEKDGYEIRLNTHPVKIQHKDGRITEVTLETTSLSSSGLTRGSSSDSRWSLPSSGIGGGNDTTRLVIARSNIIEEITSSATEVGTRNDTTYPVIARNLPAGRQAKVTKQSDVSSFKIQVSSLIESIPIKDFLNLLDPLPPKEILAANDKVKYRDQIYLFITLNKNRITNDQWIYFPEKNIPFGRISEMKNFSQKMSPVGKTSLFIEFFCFKGDEIWNKTKEELLNITIDHLENLGFCQRSEVRNSYLIKQEKVYPIYDTNYKEYLSVIKNYLNQFSNLHYIGRPGRFRYNNQDHSLEMGFLSAKSVIEGIKYDIETVGMETEYYEKGLISAGINNNPSFLKYSFCATIAAAVDFSLLYSLTEFFGFWYFTATFWGYLGGIVTNFTINKFITFRNYDKFILPQIRMFLIVAISGLVMNQIIVYIAVEYIHIWYMLAKAIAIATIASWSFYGHKKFTFRS